MMEQQNHIRRDSARYEGRDDTMFKLLFRAGMLVLTVILILGTTYSCNIDEILRQLEGGSLQDEAADEAQLIYNVYSRTISDEADGQPLLSMKLVYPQIRNEAGSAAIDSLNLFFAEEKKVYEEEIERYGVRYAAQDKAAAATAEYPFTPHMYTQTPSIRYNGNGYVSVVYERMEETGGARTNLFYSADTLSLKDGIELTLPDFYGENAVKTVTSTVRRRLALMEESQDFIYYDSYKEDVKDLYDPEDFYLDGDRLKIFYQLDRIAPFPYGPVEFDFSLNDMRMQIEIPREASPSATEASDAAFAAAGALIEQAITAQPDAFPWESYSYEVKAISKSNATLIIYSVTATPEGKLKRTITTGMRNEEDGWQLAEALR